MLTLVKSRGRCDFYFPDNNIISIRNDSSLKELEDIEHTNENDRERERKREEEGKGKGKEKGKGKGEGKGKRQGKGKEKKEKEKGRENADGGINMKGKPAATSSETMYT